MGLIMDRSMAEALLRLARSDDDPPSEWGTAEVDTGLTSDDWGGPNPLD